MSLDLRYSQCEQKMRDIRHLTDQIRQTNDNLDVIETAMKGAEEGRSTSIKMEVRNFKEGSTVHNKVIRVDSIDAEFDWLEPLSGALRVKLDALDEELRKLVNGEEDGD